MSRYTPVGGSLLAPVTDRCVVLRTRALREADFLVTLLTESQGKLTGVAPHARRSRRRFGGALEPGIVGELTYRERPDQELVGIEDLRITRVPPSRIHELPIFATRGVVLSIVDATSPERQVAPTRFALLLQVLEALAHHPPPQVMAYFLGHWLRETGFAPSMEACVRCGRLLPVDATALFVPEEGGLVCGDCDRPRGWALPVSAPTRRSWLQAAQAAQPSDEAMTHEMQPFYQTGLWEYLCQVLGRPLPAAPYWNMIWTGASS